MEICYRANQKADGLTRMSDSKKLLLSLFIFFGPLNAYGRPEISIYSIRDKEIKNSGDRMTQRGLSLKLLVPLVREQFFLGLTGDYEKHIRTNTGNSQSVSGGLSLAGLVLAYPMNPAIKEWQYLLMTSVGGGAEQQSGSEMNEIVVGGILTPDSQSKVKLFYRGRIRPHLVRHVFDALYEYETNSGYDIIIGTSQLTLLRTSFSGKGRVFVGVLADTADYYSGTHEKYWAVGYNLRGQLGATLKVADYTNMRIALKSGREFLEIFDHKGDRLRKEEAVERLIIEGAVSLSF